MCSSDRLINPDRLLLHTMETTSCGLKVQFKIFITLGFITLDMILYS